MFEFFQIQYKHIDDMPETTKKLDFILCFRSLSTQVFRVSFKLIVKKFSDVDFSTLTPFFVPSRFHVNPYLEINDIECKKIVFTNHR